MRHCPHSVVLSLGTSFHFVSYSRPPKPSHGSNFNTLLARDSDHIDLFGLGSELGGPQHHQQDDNLLAALDLVLLGLIAPQVRT